MLGRWGNGDTKLIRVIDRNHPTVFLSDTYVSKYKLLAIDCATRPTSQNDVIWFYQDPSPMFDFDNSFTHVLQHHNQLLASAPQWKYLSDYIISFNIQNERQGHLHGNIAPAPDWWCDRSKKMRSVTAVVRF
jgi:hypothetical protein